MALGPLGLSYEDLWHVTIGEIKDLTIADNYKRHLKRREDFIFASLLGAAVGGGLKNVTIDDYAGRWVNNQIMEPDAANEYILERVRKNG